MNIILNIAKGWANHKCFVCNSKANSYFKYTRCSRLKCSIKIRSYYKTNNHCQFKIGKTAFIITDCYYSKPQVKLSFLENWYDFDIDFFNNVEFSNIQNYIAKRLIFK